MGKRRELLNENKIQKYIKMGYGSGERQEYKPWIEIQDFPSEGRVSRPFGWKTNRIHQFLSDLETMYFYLLEWSDAIVDIREQYPLFDRDLSKKIAEEKGIKYPVDTNTGTSIVLTTDFMITVRVNGKTKQIARTIKPSSDLEKKRVIEKFVLERYYWKEKGIDWAIVTENDINKIFAHNVEWIHSFYRFDDLGFEDTQYFNDLKNVLKYKLSKENIAVKTLLANLDAEYNTDQGTFLKIFKNMIATKQIHIDMSKKVNLNTKIKDYICDETQTFKEMMAE